VPTREGVKLSKSSAVPYVLQIKPGKTRKDDISIAETAITKKILYPILRYNA